MLQRRIITLCTCLLIFFASHAQVSPQTGSATFSLPIFNWQDNKSRLNTLVALSYSSGNGLKVNDVASNVGQGWSLVSGGVITRMQVGEPDDQKAYEGNGKESDIRKYPNGFLYSYNTAQDSRNGCPLALTKYPIYGSMNQVYKQHNAVASDKQLDYFSFQFNGKAGMFVLDPARGDVGAFLGDTKMKISFQRNENMANTRTTITSFSIQDVDGLIYRFKDHGSMKVLEQNYCDADLKEKHTQPKFDGGNVYHQKGFENPLFVNPWVINSWYLSEIEDPFTLASDGVHHVKITFSYDVPRNVNNIAGIDISYDSWHDYSTVTHKTSITRALDIKTIVMPDGHNVTFNYGSDRVDLSGEKALSSVDITYQGRYLSRHQLTTSYFILNRYGTPVTDYQKKAARLCLLSVKKLGIDLKDDSPPYKFDYYMGSNSPDDVVPPAFSFAHDIWGFYNGSNSADYSSNPISPLDMLTYPNNNQCKGLCFLRNNVTAPYLNAKDGYAKNGLLRQIIYPTGGTLSYQYQQNTGVIMHTSSNIVVGGVHVSQTSSTDGGYSNGCANPLVTHYNYVLENSSQSSMWGLEMPVNQDAVTMHYEPEERKYKWTWRTAPAGSCVYTYRYPGILSQNQSIDLTSFQKTMDAIAPVLGVISTITTIVDIVSLACGATGFLAWVGVIIQAVGSLITIGISCFSDNSKDGTTISYHNSDLNATSPLPTQFKRVEVVEGPGGNGRTVQVFTSDDDYPIWYETNPHFIARQRFAPWAYGLPRFTTVFDALGNKVKETEYQYDFDKAQGILGQSCFKCPPPPTGIYSDLVSCKCLVEKTTSQRNTDWVQPVKYNADYQMQNVSGVLDVDFYGMYTGRTELEENIERVYKKNDATQFVETHTTYLYNFITPNYEVKSITVRQSNGDYISKDITYSGDYNSGVFGVMNANNMVSVPVSVAEYVSKAGGTGSGYTSRKVTEFTQLPNGDIKPLQVLEQRSDRPGSLAFYGGPGNADYFKLKVTQLFTYDASGNLIGAKDEGNRLVANIYDYQDKYAVASVINADAFVDKPAYTSFETDVFGGWNLSGTANYVNNSGITGARVYNLAASTLSRTLNTGKPYLVSFWANNSNVVVTGGATLTKSAPVINGFTYYEYEIAAGTGSVTVTGSAYIDELRLYPKTARMRTVTYDPLIGKTSECDENNRATYYEYDDLARLRFIKDENRNIVKMYEYNNVSKQNGCPGTYTNYQITEMFTKSNCGAGYIGTDVPYTIPANKYTSTISQADADAQAEQELLTLGQQQADNAGPQYCKQIFYNDPQSQPFTTQTCEDGYEGGQVTYYVDANKYSSLISPGDANQKALREIAANGQAHANDPDYAVCIADTRPIWEWLPGAATYCTNVNGQTPAHIMVLATDINPNSSTYNQTSWQDGGVSDQCPSAWYSTDQSGYYYKQTCPAGPTYGDAIYIQVGPGSFGSNVSIEDANNQARQWAQEQANNTDGYCQVPMIHLDYSSNAPDWIRIELQSTTDYNGYYYFEIPSGYPNQASGYWSIPAGTYDVTFTPYNMDSWYYHDYITCGEDNYKWDRWEPWTFHNVLFNDDCHYLNVGSNYSN